MSWLVHVRRIASDRRLILIFLLVAAILFGLVKLASEVLEGESFALDKQIMLGLRDPLNLMHPLGPKWLFEAMRDVTALGGVTCLTLVTVLTTLYFVAARKPRSAAFVAAAVSLGAILADQLKNVFLRPRPEIVPHLVEVSNSSFPSGHAMNSAIVYLTLAALLARTQASRTVRLYIQAAAVALTLTIGGSRVYLGVHWPSDVIAGWCAGGLWAVLCSIAYHRMLPRSGPTDRPEK